MKINTGISEENRKKAAQLLNQLLADEHVLYIKTRNFHWNVRGMDFKTLHEFFEEQYNELSVMIDDLAERIRAIGHFALGTMKEYIASARLKEADSNSGDAQQMLSTLLDDHEKIIRTMREDLKKEDEVYQDAGTSDFITGLMEKHEKIAWMIRSYIN